MKLLKFKISIVAFALLLAPMFFVSCYRNEQALPSADTTQTVNKWVYDITKTYYLWEKYIPGSIDITTYDNPAKLFKAMYYPTLDKWSFLTDDYTGLMNDLNGVRKASGFKFRPFLYEEGKTDVFIFVEYVHTDGNAYKAGLKRGSVITKINGISLNKDNLSKLINNDELKLSIAEYKDKKIVDLNKTITVTKVEQSFSPILQHKVIDKNGKKIGYFLYDQFISKYDAEMTQVLSNFKNEEIDDLVLDLRYNSGGYVSTCAKLGSMIVPKNDIGKVFMKNQWNDLLTKGFESNLEKYQDRLQLLIPKPTVNLGMKNLYVLCSDRTASASEAIINCLKPYMNVVLIGTTTVGKYTAVTVFNEEKKPILQKWGLFLVIYKIANANGVTDFVDGLQPDFVVKDNYTTPLGDENEPLLAKALNLITGSVAKKAVKELPDNIKILEPIYESNFEKEALMVNDAIPVK